MSEPSPSTQGTTADTSDLDASATIHPASLPLRIKFALTGVVYPLIALALSFSSPPIVSTPWQSGKTQDYVAMLMTFPGFGPFLPLVFFCMASLTFWLFHADLRKAPLFALGIATGPLIALQFLIFVVITTGPFSFFFAAIVAPVQAILVYAIFGLWSRAGTFTIRYLLLATAGIAIVAGTIKATGTGSDAADLALGSLFYTAAGSPVLCLVTYIRAVIYLSRQSAWAGLFRWPRITLPVGWCLTWMVSWKFGVDLMLREYAKLPTTPPQCYVCSSAAHGHRWLVRSHPRSLDGILVNPQMRRLKFLEFAIAAAFPLGHRRLRRVYDRVGPPIAAWCAKNRFVADAVYLAFKPLEWIAMGLARQTRFHADLIEQLYRR